MITEREFLERARLDRRTLTVWIEEEWLIPAREADELAFTDMDLARVNLIRDLKDKMGVNDEGLDVVLHLVDQMHALRRALAAALEVRARATALIGAINRLSDAAGSVARAHREDGTGAATRRANGARNPCLHDSP